MGELLQTIANVILKLIPGEGGRSYFLGIAGVLYALIGLLLKHLTPEQAGLIASGAIGILTAAVHKHES